MSSRIVKIEAVLVPVSKNNSFLFSVFLKPGWVALLQVSLHVGDGSASTKRCR